MTKILITANNKLENKNRVDTEPAMIGWQLYTHVYFANNLSKIHDKFVNNISR